MKECYDIRAWKVQISTDKDRHSNVFKPQA